MLPLLAPAAKDGDNAVTVAVRNGTTICAVYPGYADRATGVAVDVGSTTIAAHLVDLASGEILATNGIMNPQIRFGDDLMSRVSYVMMNPGGDIELTRAVRTALDTMIGELVDEVALKRDAVLDMSIVANPIMHHVLLGIDPTPLGQAPFTLATDGPVTTRAADLDLDARFAEAYLLPCIAGHVGADTAGAILAEGPHRDTGDNCSSTSGPTPKSSSATPITSSLRRAQRGRRSKVPRSRPACALLRARSNECGSTATRSSRA